MIPARLGAARLPNKPLVDIEGLPLLEHVRRRALAARSVRRVLVATDAPEIGEAVQAHGGEVLWTGPAPTGSHRVAWAVGLAPVPVINVQGDQPLLDPDHVDRVAAALAEGAPLVTVAAPWPEGVVPEDRDRVKIAPGPRFSRDPLPGARLHLGIYGFQPEILVRVGEIAPTPRSIDEGLEQLAWLEAGLPMRVIDVERAAMSVDTPAQLEAVRRVLRQGRSGSSGSCASAEGRVSR